MTPEQEVRCHVMSLLFEVHRKCGEDDTCAFTLLRSKLVTATPQWREAEELLADEVLKHREFSPEERAADFQSHLASLSPDEQWSRWVIACHEAGHAMALKLRGRTAIFATIEPHNGSDGILRNGIVVVPGTLPPHADILFALSGPAAEARVTGRYVCAGDDKSHSEEAIKRLSKPMEYYRDEAAAMVNQSWDSIVALANALMDRGTLWSAREISQLSG